MIKKITNNISIYDKINVYYAGDFAYINDGKDGQIMEEASIVDTFNFHCITESDFDYLASDDEAKELGDYLSKEICEDPNKRIDIWDYFDEISEEMKTLTDADFGIDTKKDIVSSMADKKHLKEIKIYGATKFIAKYLYDSLKNEIETQRIKELLSTIDGDDCDIKKFKDILLSKLLTIELETTNGDAIGAISLKTKDLNIEKLDGNISIVTNNDYNVFDAEQKIRVQLKEY